MQMTPTEQLDTLLNVWEKLAPMERTTALAYLHRLYAGQRRFGPLKTDKKEWTYEAKEEALDAAVYLSALLAEHSMKAMERMVEEAENEVRTRSTG
jgi:hypothetical protein